MKKILVAVLLIVGTPALPGCKTLRKLDPPAIEFVKADIAFYELVGQRLAGYLQADTTLTDSQRSALLNAISDWLFMINMAAERHGIDAPEAFVPGETPIQ